MISTDLDRLNDEIQQLTLMEQVWLLEQLAHHIRNQAAHQQGIESQLEAMASDPQIQRELREIEVEFGPADFDGLSD